MAIRTERIEIVIREDGSRLVVRNLDEIGKASKRTFDSVGFMKKALVGLGAGLAAQAVLKYADAYTTLQNKLRASGLEGAVLDAVYQKLLRTANDTRSSLEGTISIYSRLNQNSRELGVSQNELIGFTKSLNQAIGLSGATSTEASAALIQLSQGMASGTLRGDELRSVLEQLPVVADVIAKRMGITRGQIKDMGEQGKITSKIIIAAFKDAATDLEARFAKTVPTISQSLVVLQNNITDAIGRFDKSSGGLSKGIATVIITIARNLDAIAFAALDVAKAITVLTASYVAFNAATRAVDLATKISEFLEFRKAVAAGNIVLIGSAEAEHQRAAAALEAQLAIQAATATQAEASLVSVRSAAAATAAQVADTAATQAALVSARQDAIAKLARANAQVALTKAAKESALSTLAQTGSMDTLLRATLAQSAAERARLVVLGELGVLGEQQARINAEAATAAAANAAAQTALNEAQAAGAVANAAAAGATAKAATAAATAAAAAAGSTSLLSQAFAGLKTVLASVFGTVLKLLNLVNKNPFVVIVTSLVTLIGLLTAFGDDVKIGIDNLTTFGDVGRVVGGDILDAFKSLGAGIASAFSGVTDVVKSMLSGISDLIGPAITTYLASFDGFFDGVGNGFVGVVRSVARVVDAIAGLLTGLDIAMIRIFTGLPKVILTAFKNIYNSSASVVEDLVNLVVDNMNKLRSLVGMTLFDTIKITKLDVDEKAFETYGKHIASSIEDGFEQQDGFAEKFVNNIFDRAQKLAQARKPSQVEEVKINLDKKSIPKAPAVDQKAYKQAENALRSLLNTIYPAAGAVLELDKAERVLNKAVAEGVLKTDEYSTAQEKADYFLELARLHYEDIINPIGKMNREMQEEASLLQMNSRAREVEAQVMQDVRTLREQGIILTKEEIATRKQNLVTMQQLADQSAALDDIYSQTMLAEYDMQVQALATNQAYKDKLITLDEYKRRIVELTVAQANLRLELGEGTFGDLQIASLGRVVEGYRNLLSGLSNAFGDFFVDFTDGFANSIGNAIVYADDLKTALGDVARQAVAGLISSLVKLGIQSVINATLGRTLAAATLASTTAASVAAAATTAAAWAPAAAMVSLASFGANSVPAAAGIATTSALAQGLALVGYQQGGYTGDSPINKVVGTVHGKEYVMDAEATKRIGVQNLDSLREGTTTMARNDSSATKGGSRSGDLKVTLNNYGTSKEFEVQQLSADEIRVIARDEATKEVVKRSPDVIASEVTNPNSKVSKAFSKSTNLSRRR